MKPCLFIKIILLAFCCSNLGSFDTQADNTRNSTLFTEINKVQDPLTLYAELIAESVSAGNYLKLKIWGRLLKGHHIYSITPQGEFTPDPTKLLILKKGFLPISDLIESEPAVIEDRAFDLALKVHKNDFWLEQSFEVVEGVDHRLRKVKGVLLYQVCDNLICSLPLEKEFSAAIATKPNP